jgi:hypothetical protein
MHGMQRWGRSISAGGPHHSPLDILAAAARTRAAYSTAKGPTSSLAKPSRRMSSCIDCRSLGRIPGCPELSGGSRGWCLRGAATVLGAWDATTEREFAML